MLVPRGDPNASELREVSSDPTARTESPGAWGGGGAGGGSGEGGAVRTSPAICLVRVSEGSLTFRAGPALRPLQPARGDYFISHPLSSQ